MRSRFLDMLPIAQVLMPGTSSYPRGLMAFERPPTIYVRGNAALLELRLIGLFCSIRCPGGAILRAFDWVNTVPMTGVAVLSGFHSPIEQECLSLLLRRGIPVVICPAREITQYRYPELWDAALAAGQLLMLSLCASEKRATVALAEKRNVFVAALADSLVVIHAPEGSRTNTIVESTVDKPIIRLA